MFAVPVAIVALWLGSLAAQVGVVWPNYEAELKKAEQAEKGASESEKAKSEKAKSEQGEKRASKNKHRKGDESSSEAVSTGKRKQQQD
jgi:hypothetical protein